VLPSLSAVFDFAFRQDFLDRVVDVVRSQIVFERSFRRPACNTFRASGLVLEYFKD
jgi:hypothetical protein